MPCEAIDTGRDPDFAAAISSGSVRNGLSVRTTSTVGADISMVSG